MNTEQYLSEVYRIIREGFRSNDASGGMTVASAAYLVKRTLHVEQTAFGFAKFKDVLQVLENQGLLKTGTNSKDAYSLWLADEPKPSATVSSFRPLRKDVWFAFVSEQPGKRYFNFRSGEIRFSLDDVPAGEGWAEICPLDPDKERELARDFLQRYGIDDPQVAESVGHERWYVEFPNILAEQHPGLAAEWKRRRSQRVSKVVADWCRQHSVDERLVFHEPPRKAVVVGGAIPQAKADENLRAILLAVINKLPTHELLQLRLPAHEVVAALRPELLN